MAALVLAVFGLGNAGEQRPIPVPAESAVPLPTPGLFGGSLVLYGAAGAVGDSIPDRRDLGCVLTRPSGNLRRGINTLRALRAPDREVAGTRLTPLAVITLYPRAGLLCSGPVARSAQPLYLLGEEPSAVPRIFAASFGLLALALGTGALALLRYRRGARAATAS